MGFKLDDHYEKDYFTVEELAKQWDCSLGDINYLIEETGELRLGMKVDNKLDTSLIAIDTDFDIKSLIKAVATAYRDDSFEKDFGSVIFDLSQIKAAPAVSDLFSDSVQLEVVSDEPKYIYTDRANRVYLPKGLDRSGMSVVGYFSAQDLWGQRYLFMEPSASCAIFSHFIDHQFNVVTREERDRFIKEQSGGIDQDKVSGDPPFTETSSIQSCRELVLKGWLAGRSINLNSELSMTRLELWSELSMATPELFRPLGQDAINDFFSNHRLCSFRRGRPKKGIK